jgi:hypothetical protein
VHDLIEPLSPPPPRPKAFGPIPVKLPLGGAAEQSALLIGVRVIHRDQDIAIAHDPLANQPPKLIYLPLRIAFIGFGIPPSDEIPTLDLGPVLFDESDVVEPNAALRHPQKRMLR